MESSPSSVRWSELIHAGVLAASQIKVRFSALARKLCWIRLASRKLVLLESRLGMVWVDGRWLSIVKSPPIHDSPATRSLGGRSFGRSCAFPPDPPPVACYEGTLLPDEINRQCTPAQLQVKPRSTAKRQKRRYLDGIEKDINIAG